MTANLTEQRINGHIWLRIYTEFINKQTTISVAISTGNNSRIIPKVKNKFSQYYIKCLIVNKNYEICEKTWLN